MFFLNQSKIFQTYLSIGGAITDSTAEVFVKNLKVKSTRFGSTMQGILTSVAFKTPN